MAPASIIINWRKKAVGPRNTVTKIITLTLEPTLNANIFSIMLGVIMERYQWFLF
jgi:hypothetical protein